MPSQYTRYENLATQRDRRHTAAYTLRQAVIGIKGSYLIISGEAVTRKSLAGNDDLHSLKSKAPHLLPNDAVRLGSRLSKAIIRRNHITVMNNLQGQNYA